MNASTATGLIFISFFPIARFKMSQLTSQTIIPIPVLPIKGPPGFHQFSQSLNFLDASDITIINPIVKHPNAAERIAAKATPEDFVFLGFVNNEFILDSFLIVSV